MHTSLDRIGTGKVLVGEPSRRTARVTDQWVFKSETYDNCNLRSELWVPVRCFRHQVLVKRA